MNKKINAIVFIMCFFIINIKIVSAASVSVSASSNYVTTGSQVTFYVRINDSVSWVLEGHGIGATSGCSLSDNDRVGDSGTSGTTSKTITATCTATSEGTVGFVVTGKVWDKNVSPVPINASKSVTVQKPREKDSNNYLKSLNVSGYNLSPAFNKDTLEYTVNVPSTVDKVTLEAALESGYASMTGTGEFEVNEGVNTFEINVTSETGISRVYKLTINVQDEHPIDVEVGSSKYTIMKNAKTLEKPSTYEATTVKIKEFEIPAFYSEISKFTLIGAKDTKGTTHFLIYDKEKSTYELYNENKASEQILYIEKMEDNKDGFTKQTKTINGASYEVLVSDVDSTIVLVKAMNIKTGEIHLYQYDEKVGSYIIYNDALISNLEVEIKKYKDVVLYFTIAMGVSIFFILILLCRRPKRKKEESKIEELKIEDEKSSNAKEPKQEKMTKKQKKQEKKNQKKEQKNQKKKEPEAEAQEEKTSDEKVETTPKEEKTPSKKTLEEAMKKVNDATSIIEEYEKTMRLNKKELEKKKQELEEKEQKEETMYNIFEDDKR